MTPDQYCENKASQSGSSFYYAFRFLPPEKRAAITAFYAFCREADDLVDEVSDTNVARTKLLFWRKEIDALYANAPQHPVTKALQRHVVPMRLPQQAFHTVLDGMQQDLEKTRYLDFNELKLYCYQAAGVVGEVSARIFGIDSPENPKTLEYARTMGEALQLMNIIRDVGEDARRGRIYLPSDDLVRFNVSVADILQSRSTDAFKAMMQFQYERASATYDRALAVLPAEDKRAQKPGLAMGAIYRALLEEIKRDGFGVLERRVSLTPVRKLWIAWKTVTFA
ncbi:MAG: squalene synthase HpnD [Burkholderiales bacterium]|nr:MAG: squalene synthase HpnD [Betaproteobacteria bacterium]TAG79588.1 MAG: squalene synthase HpnD [Burkholderiales bacterium]